MAGLVTIFGCGGFLGRYIAEEALDAGWRVRAAERQPAKATFIKPMGNLGQTQFVAADVTRFETVERAVAGSDAVINLVGTFDGASMQRVHVDGAGNVARAAAAAGATRMIHMSAIGADANSPSRYGQTKANGEAAVRDAFPDAVILRPSVVFGAEDQFINRFAGMIRTLPIVPVIGGATKFQPVFAGDIGKAAAKLLDSGADHAARTFELGGPEVYSMREIFEWIGRETGRERMFVDLPDPVAKAIAYGTGFAPNTPISPDQLKMLETDNVVSSGAGTFADLDIRPGSMEVIAARYLTHYRNHGRFGRRMSA